MLQITHIPLAKLVPSPANVRKAGRKEGIKELAASIKAHGLLQNLTVRTGSGDNQGRFEVIAGGRRLAALRLLERAKHVKGSSKIACHIDDSEFAEEISLAENLYQCPMHPADQYEAFAKLAAQDMPAEDIAARFGISPAIVTQRLKLGSVNPKLIKLYRDGELTLDLLTAFTITDDAKAQWRVWNDLPEFNRSRRAILDALTEEKVPADDRRAVFVGLTAFSEAGGTVTRDLFDTDGGGFLNEPELLNRLVREKLQRKAAKVIAEGWKWVSVEVEYDRESAAQMRRVHPALLLEDKQKLSKLEVKREAMWEDEERPIPADLEAVEDDIAAIEKRACFAPDDLARCGAFVCLDSDGQLRIERGYLRKEDAAPVAAAEGEYDEPCEAPAPRGLSEKLLGELTAARTGGLRAELAQDPDLALTAVVHAMACRLLYQDSERSCLELSAKHDPLTAIASAEAESQAAQALAASVERWREQLPTGPELLWNFLISWTVEDRMALLAVLAAMTVNAVAGRCQSDHHADVLHCSLPLDMARYWKPTAANYLGRVAKDVALEAVREAVTPEAADNLATMKKAAMAEAATQRLEGKGWLPDCLRLPH